MPDDLRLYPINAGSRGLARDPAEIYERQEAMTCAGCVHITTIAIAGTEHEACGLERPFGKRCRSYAERKPVRW